MILKELLDIARRSLRDTVGLDKDKYWSDADLTEYLNEAQDEMVRETLCISDSLTDDICLITLVDGQRHYALSPTIIEIEQVLPSWSPVPLCDAKTFKQFRQNWNTAVALPHYYACDYSDGYITFDSTLDVYAGESIRLTVKRMPKLITSTQAPEIKPDYQRYLRYFVLYRAFSKQDAEVYNPRKAQDELAMWQAALRKVNQAEMRLRPRIMQIRREYL